MKAQIKIYLVLTTLTVGLIFAGCGKGNDNNNNNQAVNPFGVGMIGSYLTSAVGNDGGTGSVVNGGYGNTTVQLELSFYGQSQPGAIVFSGPVSAQGYLRILSNPYGCPSLQSDYFNGVSTIPVSTVNPGTLTGSVFSNLVLQTQTGASISIPINGHFGPGGYQGLGPNGSGTSIYPNTLEATLSIAGGCLMQID